MPVVVRYRERKGDEKRDRHRHRRKGETEEPVLFPIGTGPGQRNVDEPISEERCQR